MEPEIKGKAERLIEEMIEAEEEIDAADEELRRIFQFNKKLWRLTRDRARRRIDRSSSDIVKLIEEAKGNFDWTLLAKLPIWRARHIYENAFESIHIEQIKEEFIESGISELYQSKERQFRRDVYKDEQ